MRSGARRAASGRKTCCASTASYLLKTRDVFDIEIHAHKPQVKIGERIGDFVKLAIACAAIYAIVHWQVIGPQDDDLATYAKSMCVDAIRDRYDTTMVSPYAVKENTNGYTVRASITMSTGAVTKAYCRANKQGGVIDVSIER